MLDCKTCRWLCPHKYRRWLGNPLNSLKRIALGITVEDYGIFRANRPMLLVKNNSWPWMRKRGNGQGLDACP